MGVSFGHAGYNKTAFPVRKRIITVGPKGGLGYDKQKRRRGRTPCCYDVLASQKPEKTEKKTPPKDTCASPASSKRRESSVSCLYFLVLLLPATSMLRPPKWTEKFIG
ncbi:hypothetical protein H112_03578 [Trichophyton rubrum D6]|uniref:Uncharacterized protein n=2 Tax=Trichophyton TaxID=5550 RepID=A0A022W5X6_TRIRU|nr:hypothetical protein H100_03583 [Trichophyton rubrum MR850]EZF42864.1 hypothetical protein H102_03576 [Trichophyton rubrum CBS 100081]EZF53493.1 hypothetical protein H103_03586 [Trichophyton rubrum CBS 288.86]EZF64111.1 hypothetical protein H104_03573 [Trichophyton rubrum CBS 289.86]EZF74715.1 hypothetical protein H105_03601 [Trichophyton soudanense CBS 452.61]EZF85406.1 hypothetical protein H110_03585 [Trichophyton rubrum MR1448]EZF96163.1 hypothetical protein H113_03606 [Trichophyton rub